MRKSRSLSLLLTTILVSGMMIPNAVFASGKFSDVSNHWAEKQISQWVDKGFVSGYEDQTFKPDHEITRAEFIALVNRSFGFTDTKATFFVDVKSEDWFAQEVAKATAAGYIGGYEDGTIRPNNPISRQEVASILTRLKHLSTGNGLEILNQFHDNSAIPQWSQNVVAAVIEKGYMSGYPDATFQPDRSITRAEAIVALDRAITSSVSTSNDGQSQTKPTIYSQQGTYGPQTGTQTIQGDVVIDAPGVTLQNVAITGNLVLSEAVGEGDVNLSNVNVSGTVTVHGGGEHSVHLNNVAISQLIIDKKSGKVRVEATGSSTIQSTTIYSSAVLEANGLTSASFDHVSLEGQGTNLSSVSLAGDYNQVDINSSPVHLEFTKGTINQLNVASQAKGSTLSLSDNTSLNTLTLNAAVQVQGNGVIDNAVANVIGSTFAQQPKTITQAPAGAVGGGGGGGTVITTTTDVVSPEATNLSIAGFPFTGSGNNLSVSISSSTTIQTLNTTVNTPCTVELLSLSGIDLSKHQSLSRKVDISAGSQNINIFDMLGIGMLHDGVSADMFGVKQLNMVVKLTSKADSTKATTYNLTVYIN